MTFNPYLNFDGQCAEALTFYADLFGATDLTLMPYKDAPDSEQLPASDRIMYGHIMLGEACLMASDFPPGMPAKPMESVSVNHPVPDAATGQKIFAALAEGGDVTMPYAPTFFSRAFGMVRDRFGTNWMIGVAPDEQA
ncbi:PhnB protein [Shimia isoporae]|uniref:PhnB protein n=1 Tax=Shimia isoporae TaxID=647720 RepID=A0A4R1NU20_9RHOB|nr:VOC family protein [Shimia isoporae]TCL08768.1 PhnB protein [Shimia isoporae]